MAHARYIGLGEDCAICCVPGQKAYFSLGNCPHCLCEECVMNLTDPKCPFCRARFNRAIRLGNFTGNQGTIIIVGAQRNWNYYSCGIIILSIVLGFSFLIYQHFSGRHIQKAADTDTIKETQAAYHDITKERQTAREMLERIRAKPVETLKVSDRSPVTGITKLGSRIYVTTTLSNDIYVFDSDGYLRLKSIEISGDETTNVADIVASPNSGSLYYHVPNNGGSIYRIWVSDRKIELWLNKTIAKGRSERLSVLSNGDVMLLNYNPPMIDIFSASDGALKESIRLPPDMEHPNHVIWLPSGEFLVAQGSARIDTIWGSSQRICKISQTGKTLQPCFGEWPGSDDEHLSYPDQLAVDDDGRIYVSDCGNDRVLVIDRKLLAARVLLGVPAGKKIKPFRSCARLFYDRDSNKLLVGQDSGRVNVFTISTE